jgi:hypothetical protein
MSAVTGTAASAEGVAPEEASLGVRAPLGPGLTRGIVMDGLSSAIGARCCSASERPMK